MKIALFLGSFNPFHNGHLHIIRTAINNFKVDKVIIVPKLHNSLITKEKILDFEKRRDIIANSIISTTRNYSKIYIDDIEKSLTFPYYNYATLHALKNKYCNDKIFILCGEDTIEEISNWMNGEQVIKDYDFLVVDRNKYSISSTRIRELLKTRNKMDAYYNDRYLEQFVPKNIIRLLKTYY